MTPHQAYLLTMRKEAIIQFHMESDSLINTFGFSAAEFVALPVIDGFYI